MFVMLRFLPAAALLLAVPVRLAAGQRLDFTVNHVGLAIGDVPVANVHIERAITRQRLMTS